MKKALLATVVIAGAGYGVYRWRSEPAPTPKRHDDLVTDRLWVDHIPRSERDVIQIFAAITEEPIGIFQSTSVWKGEFEMFRYESHRGELRIFYPQSGQADKVKAKATECDKNGMDFCLELDGSSHGVKRYYSREGWEIGSAADLKKLTVKIRDGQ